MATTEGSTTETDTTGAESEVELRRIPQQPESRLPPLGGGPIYTHDTSDPLPPINPHGGVAAKLPNDITISIPEGDGGGPEKTEKGTIYMPGGETNEYASYSARGTMDEGKAIDVVVYFMDKTGVQISLPNGKHADAGTLFETVMSVKKFHPEAREAFSLWLVSDLLELQLKPTHIPFKLVAYWEELLEKYTQATESDIERDEPVIMFQRNVFYPRAREAQITDEEMLRLLYHEAKENVLDSRYPLSKRECDDLAGIQAMIQAKTFDRETHTPDFYKNKLNEFYPNRYCKTTWMSKENPAKRLNESHFNASKKLTRIESSQSHIDAYRWYLESCRKLPYYGAAFFKGQIEHPQRSKFSLGGHVDDPVYIAVNTDGVFIIDMDDMVFLLGLLYRDFSWDYAEPKNKDDRNCLPCLFIQFKGQENREEVTKLLQIFTREAVLVDALTEACVKLKKKRKEADTVDGGVDGVDGVKDTYDGRDDGILQAEGDDWKNFNRLALTTFSKQGNQWMVREK